MLLYFQIIGINQQLTRIWKWNFIRVNVDKPLVSIHSWFKDLTDNRL